MSSAHSSSSASAMFRRQATHFSGSRSSETRRPPRTRAPQPARSTSSLATLRSRAPRSRPAQRRARRGSDRSTARPDGSAGPAHPPRAPRGPHARAVPGWRARGRPAPRQPLRRRRRSCRHGPRPETGTARRPEASSEYRTRGRSASRGEGRRRRTGRAPSPSQSGPSSWEQRSSIACSLPAQL